MTTRTVTGNIKTLTDSAVSSGVVTFEKVVTSTTGNTIHQFGTTTATTDGSGDFSIALAVPASGSYRYRMILPNGDAFYFSIASGASVNVATLIVAEIIIDSDAIVEALAAYLPLSGGTMTGQLNFSGTTHAGIKLLTLTTAQRDALTAANGMVIYNSTTATHQVYQGGAWVSLTIASDLTTHTALTVTAHGGLVPQDAAILSKSGAYPLAAGDEAKIIECNGTFTITLPNGLDTGFQAVIVNIGTGVITLAATTTLTTKDSAVTLANQYGAATVYHAGSNVWRAFGDLS